MQQVQQRSQSAQQQPQPQQQTGENSVGSDISVGGPAQGGDGGGGGTGANPGEIVRDGSAVTQHRDVGIEDAVNTGTPDPGECADADMKIKVKATKAAPVKVNGDGAASEVDLFQQVETDDGVQINGFSGTVASPTVQEAPHPTAIYIEDQPVIDDIHQAAFADCYFLASLGSATAKDPSFVKNTLVGAPGPSVTVTLNRWDSTAATPAWVPAPISVDRKLLALKGGTSDGKLIGAGFRVGTKPTESNWWVEVKDGVAHVHRQNILELALWAPLVEKAYARFVERFGQYGGGTGGTEKGGPGGGSGYDNINGGIAHYSYKLLYGGNATIGETAVNAAPGTDLVATNLPAIRNLLKVSGDSSVPNNRNFVMTAGLSRNDAVERLDAYTKAVLDNTTLIKKYKSLKTPLQNIRSVIDAWRNETDNDKKAKKLETVSKYAHSVCKPGAYPHLHSDSAEQEFKVLNEHLNIVALIATDHSEGQRFTYAWHSYSVLGAKFRDGEGKDLAVTISNLSTESAKIDADKSTVDLRNPHGKNSPNEHGTADQSSDDGNFSLSLGQFFRSFGFQQHGLVPK